MIDYTLLGALLGSAWREQNPNVSEHSPFRASALKTLNALSVPSSEYGAYNQALERTIRGLCYACGTATNTQWTIGVYCCPVCAVRKAGSNGRL